ncbi:MAG: metallophosphoesterase family protein [Balneolaceae bacterium]|nr:metallophosphoesterase family protein [Balneolaceae bacterium]
MKNDLVVIGDIHGCVKSMRALWDKLKPWKDLPHVFVGDYIDRGPDSKGVVDFMLSAQSERQCIFLRGNHEQMLLDAYERGDAYNWMMNGGEATLKSYGEDIRVTELPDDHIKFYKESRLYYQTDDYFIVHAGAPPHQTIKKSLKDVEASKQFFLWGREHLNVYQTPWEKTVVFGHTPRPNPINRDKMIGIDTGCVYNRMGYGKLTAVILPETKFIQQKSID